MPSACHPYFGRNSWGNQLKLQCFFGHTLSQKYVKLIFIRLQLLTATSIFTTSIHPYALHLQTLPRYSSFLFSSTSKFSFRFSYFPYLAGENRQQHWVHAQKMLSPPTWTFRTCKNLFTRMSRVFHFHGDIASTINISLLEHLFHKLKQYRSKLILCKLLKFASFSYLYIFFYIKNFVSIQYRSP